MLFNVLAYKNILDKIGIAKSKIKTTYEIGWAKLKVHPKAGFILRTISLESFLLK
jgi:hypothetical protein